MSSCTLPTLWDTWVSSSHQEARPKNETSSSSGEQAYTGVLSLSGAVKILEAKKMDKWTLLEQERKRTPIEAENAVYNDDHTDSLTLQELQWLSNWFTQEKDVIKPYKPFEDIVGNSTKLFEITMGDDKYYWINWNGKQLWYFQRTEGNESYSIMDSGLWIPEEWIDDEYFAFFIHEKNKQKNVVYIHHVAWVSFRGIPWVLFDERNQVFEMYGYRWQVFEFDKTFKNKRSAAEYKPPLPLGEETSITWKHRQYSALWYQENIIFSYILENTPSLRNSLAKTFSLNESNTTEIINTLSRCVNCDMNRLPFTVSHMETKSDTVTFELDWWTLTRLKNLGLPQGKHTYTLPKKAVMEMILVESSILQDEFLHDFGENSGKPFGVALWDKWPNGEDLAWFAWWTSLRPLVVDVDHATYSIPTFDFVFPTMDGAKSLKNEFWRDIVELIQDENSTLPYGSANEKKNLDFAWMRQKNGKIWTASTGNHKWHASDDIDAKSFRPIGGVWWRDITGFTIYLEQSYDYKWQWPRVGDLVPRDAIVIDDRYFYSKKEHKIYHHQYGSWSEISVVGTKVYWVKKYSTLDSPDSLCTSNDEYGKYSYDIYDEKVCYGKSGVVGTRK